MLIISDIDGVLTDGKKLVSPDGTLIGKNFSDKDSDVARKMGVIFLSRESNCNQAWCKERTLRFIHASNKTFDKYEYIKSIVEGKPYAYIGDSMQDLKCLMNATYSFVPSNLSVLLRNELARAKKKTYMLPVSGGTGLLEYVYATLVQNNEID